MATKETPDNNGTERSRRFTERVAKSVDALLKPTGSVRVYPVPTGVSLGEAFKLLKNDRRRAVLEVLDDRGPLSTRDLADTVAERLTGTDRGKPRNRVYISLHQNHLDTLREAGVITCTEDTWALGPEADALLELLAAGTQIVNGGEPA